MTITCPLRHGVRPGIAQANQIAKAANSELVQLKQTMQKIRSAYQETAQQKELLGNVQFLFSDILQKGCALQREINNTYERLKQLDRELSCCDFSRIGHGGREQKLKEKQLEFWKLGNNASAFIDESTSLLNEINKWVAPSPPRTLSLLDTLEELEQDNPMTNLFAEKHRQLDAWIGEINAILETDLTTLSEGDRSELRTKIKTLRSEFFATREQIESILMDVSRASSSAFEQEGYLTLDSARMLLQRIEENAPSLTQILSQLL